MGTVACHRATPQSRKNESQEKNAFRSGNTTYNRMCHTQMHLLKTQNVHPVLRVCPLALRERSRTMNNSEKQCSYTGPSAWERAKSALANHVSENPSTSQYRSDPPPANACRDTFGGTHHSPTQGATSMETLFVSAGYWLAA